MEHDRIATKTRTIAYVGKRKCAYQTPTVLELEQCLNYTRGMGLFSQENQIVVGNRHQIWQQSHIVGHSFAPFLFSGLLLCTPSWCPELHILYSCLCLPKSCTQVPPDPIVRKHCHDKWNILEFARESILLK